VLAPSHAEFAEGVGSSFSLDLMSLMELKVRVYWALHRIVELARSVPRDMKLANSCPALPRNATRAQSCSRQMYSEVSP
jgi:hypothetical protein